MVISRTPYRISFFGGGTDYPDWYREHGGAVLAASIDKYCYLTARFLPPFFEHRYRIVYSKTEDCRAIDEIRHPAVREIIRHTGIDRGLEIHHDGDLPARSGMGSSSSFTVGLLHALNALQYRMASKQQLAMESIHIEQNMLKETVGSQDQVTAAYGGLNHISFLQNGKIHVKPVLISPERLKELNSHLMLFYTGIKRTASDIAESYVNDIGARAGQLNLMLELLEKSISVLTGRSDICDFGRLMHEAWKAKRSLSPKVSNSDVDSIYEQALSAGAAGGKLSGAGGGGFIQIFAPPECHENIREKLSGLIHVPFRFEFQGSQIIFIDPQEDYSDLDRARAGRCIAPFRERTPDMKASQE